MNSQMILALVRKDAVLYFSNRFFAFITILGLVFYIGVYFALPSEIDESLTIAVVMPESATSLFEPLQEEGLELVFFETEEALHTAVAEGDYDVGLLLPEDFAATLASGQAPTLQLYFNAYLAEEFKELYSIMFREISFMMSGQQLNVAVNEQILGSDRAGNQVAYRDRLLPLFAVFVLLMEMMGLASLISSEVGSGTIRALLVTPLSVEGLFTAKGIFGVGLAFFQAVLLLAVTGGLAQEPLLMLLALFLGALLVTGLGFLMATVTTDLMSVMGWGILGMLVLALPAFTVLIPGLTTPLMRVIPSYYLVNVVYQVMNEPGWGWAEAWLDLVALALFAVLFLALGVVALRRRFQ